MKLAAATMIAATALAFGQGDRSLTDSGNTLPTEPHYPVAATAFTPSPILVAQQGRGVPPPPALTEGSPEVQEQMLLIRNTVKNLTEALTLANSEAETLKRENEDLRLRLEAVVGTGKGDVEQRMVETLRDLRTAKQKEESTRKQLTRLAEVTQILLSAASKDIDTDIRANVETELGRTSEELGGVGGVGGGDFATDAHELPQTMLVQLDNASIIEVKDELSLVILNVGERHEAQIGMPFQIWRGTTRVGTVRVVDVRERISGAIIQNLTNDFVKVKKGDRARVDARK